MRYTIQVTNHQEATLARTAECDAMWQTVHDGPVESDHAARTAAVELARWYRFVRVYRDGTEAIWYIPPAIPRKQEELGL